MATRTNDASKASRQVDEQLARYRAMRDFEVTSEPSGAAGEKHRPKGARLLPFVVQKHAATRLHYDFRLGWSGVLKSWAVAKGPSLYPGDKRLAVQVEDHPVEYAGFEGTIPKGQYGGGTVMVWDFGDWKPLGDVERGLKEGHLKFELDGKKLKGAWALVRMHDKNGHAAKPNWLLIKEKDAFARAEGHDAVTEQSPDSAIINRNLEQIAEGKDHVWNGAQEADRKVEPTAETPTAPRQMAAPARTRRNDRSKNLGDGLRSAPKEGLPAFVMPQLAQTATGAPNGDDWIHELKLDGYRIQIRIETKNRSGRNVREAKLLTRKGLDWTHRMPDIAQAAAALDVTSAILDGEAVVLDEHGVSNFAELQAAFQEGKNKYITYFAFDLLHLDGHNLRGLSLIERKQLLTGLFSRQRKETPIRLSEHLPAQGKDVFQKACGLGAEGIISKLAGSAYTSGRGNAWLKVKCVQEQEFVIVGFTPPSKGGEGIGALLLGYYDSGKLVYAGRSGTGFTQRMSREMRKRLDGLKQTKSSLADVPRDARHDALWVRPELVAQISFATWTRDNLVRQASFKGLREDKPANEVVRESALAVGLLPDESAVRKRQQVSRSGTLKRPKETAMAALPITHPDKVLDAESGMTKKMLAEYLIAVSEWMLPHIAKRPLSVVRCPEGSEKPCFYQKHVGAGLPQGVESVAIPNRKTGAREQFLTVDSVDGLVGLAQMGVLEIHPWGSCNDSLETPDRIVFDLDPDVAIEWPTLAASAEDLRARLKRLGLVGFLKQTGGKGLHIVVPIEPEHPWATVKDFARAVAVAMEESQPDLYVIKMTKAIRKDRIYLDYQRNEREATSIAAYSPRARKGAPVAVPLRWNELKSNSAPLFHVADFADWRSRLNRDPWKEMVGARQKLTAGLFEPVGISEGK
jgi:bifunctional non-homologous end joining protein LigD